MCDKHKSLITAIGATAAIIGIVFTIGMIPFRASAIETRLSELEKEVDKQESVCDDVQYIKGRVDALCDYILDKRQEE